MATVKQDVGRQYPSTPRHNSGDWPRKAPPDQVTHTHILQTLAIKRGGLLACFFALPSRRKRAGSDIGRSHIGKRLKYHPCTPALPQVGPKKVSDAFMTSELTWSTCYDKAFLPATPPLPATRTLPHPGKCVDERRINTSQTSTATKLPSRLTDELRKHGTK